MPGSRSNRQEILADTVFIGSEKALCGRIDTEDSTARIHEHQSLPHARSNLAEFISMTAKIAHLRVNFETLLVEPYKKWRNFVVPFIFKRAVQIEFC